MGTQAHAFTASGIIGWKSGLSWGESIAGACNDATEAGVDSWTVWCIQRSLEFARDLIAKHEIEPDNVLVEHPLDMLDLGMEKPGTADLVLVIPFKMVVIVDWKFTFLDQGTAEDHDQLQAYGISGAATFKTKDVLVYLFAPRAEKNMRATGAKFDARALAKNAEWTRAVVAAARNPAAELTAGYDQCLYCRALTRCPTAQEFIVNAQEAIQYIGKPTDADAWGDLAAAAKIGEKFGGDAKDLVKDHILKGGTATGWGLGSGRTIRSCSDAKEALRRLDAAGMRDLAIEAVKISVASLPTEAVEVIADLVTEHPSSPSLKAVKVRAAA